MRYLNKHVYRLLKQNCGYTILLFLMVVLTSFMYFFVEFSVDRNQVRIQEYAETQHLEDFRFQLQEDTDRSRVLEKIHTEAIIEEKRFKKVTQISTNYYLLAPPQMLNVPYLLEGRLPVASTEVALMLQYMDNHALTIGDSITIGNHNLTIVGSMFLPDYQSFIPFNDLKQDYNQATFGVVTPDMYHMINGQEERYYAAQFKPGVDSGSAELRLSSDPAFSYLAFDSGLESSTEPLIAIDSNQSLAHSFLFLFTLITLFIFYMFYTRFIRLHRQDFGCFKALGYTARQISCAPLVYSLILSTAGGLVGMVLGFFGSSVLIQMYAQMYSFPFWERGLELRSILFGLWIPVIGTVLVTWMAIFPFLRQETFYVMHNTIKPLPNGRLTAAFQSVIGLLPETLRLPLRVVLRKWNAIFLSATAIFLMTLLFIMSASLYQSSGVALESQTTGMNYMYDIRYPDLREDEATSHGTSMYYLRQSVQLIGVDGQEFSGELVGMDNQGTQVQFMNHENTLILPAELDGIVVSEATCRLYGIQSGDTVQLIINHQPHNVSVREISRNGEADTIYTSKTQLARWMNVSPSMHNGEYSNDSSQDSNARVVTAENKLAALRSDAVSSQSSAVINQVAGILVGFLLIYLVILLNVQDSQKDMHILRLLGYSHRDINRMLVDVYKPLFVLLYMLAVPFAILTARAILRMISLQTGDYIPFQIHWWILILILTIILLQYQLVVSLFKRKVFKQTKGLGLECIPSHE
ncbi:ABC transporter permease [Paenibacillus sp. LS1]|uniref:FtsX-like permease family protein n=1 Tax=Paenibacillus sp. LS1 TaxID=2992120 RepID=UPI00223184CA|nr:ABC transporter permease [Paenibacillus sp. LS1]MCW3789994.1 ABC transporter permease [Paenibacillus sp. LS1]